MDFVDPSQDDRIRGMFAGHFLGDALGAPHEFYKWNRDTVYTGKLKIQPYRQKDARFTKKGERDLYQPVGSVTDDTQMTIALLKSLNRHKLKYNRSDVIQSYADWAHSGAKDMGKNTRFLFKNKTVAGYESRVLARDKEISEGIRDISLANGSLMRCSPLALITDWEEASIVDTKITNPYPETIAINLIYLSALRSSQLGSSLEHIIEAVRHASGIYSQKYHTEDVSEIVDIALDNEVDIDVSGKDKGLAIYGLYCAIRGLALLKQGYGYRSIIRWVITQGTRTGKGDTDTNAAITGALIGSILGYDKLIEDKTTESNWGILLQAADEVEGPLAYYVPRDFYSMTGTYSRLMER